MTSEIYDVKFYLNRGKWANNLKYIVLKVVPRINILFWAHSFIIDTAQYVKQPYMMEKFKMILGVNNKNTFN